MKNLIVIIALVCAMYLIPLSISAQKRPVKKPAPVATPVTPEPKATAKAVSPAENFFNDGLKCDAKDYDCQVSNYTKAINVGLTTKAVFKNRAAAYTGRQDFEKAIADLTKVIESDLNDASGYKDRGKAYLAMPRTSQNIQNAIKDFTSAIDLEPKDVEAFRLRANAYQTIGKEDKASADLDKALSLNPNAGEAYLERANAYLKVKDYDKAIEIYGKLITLGPVSPELYNNRAEIYLLQGNYNIAANDFSKAIELDSKNLRAFLGRGTATSRLGKFDLANSDFNKVIEINPKSSRALVGMAEIFEIQEKYDDALKIYDRLLVLEPSSPIPLYKRASMNFKRRNYDLVLPDLEKTLALDPNNAKAFESRCMLNKVLKKYNDALADCSKAISLDSTLEDAFFYRAYAKFRLEGTIRYHYASLNVQEDTAQGAKNVIANANRTLEHTPDDYNALLNRGWASGNKEDLDAAIRIRPNLSDAYIGRGWANMKKDVDAAYKDFTRARELEPMNEDLYDGLRVLVDPRDAKALLPLFTLGLERMPNSIRLHASRASAYKALEDYPKCIADVSRVLELGLAMKKSGNRDWNYDELRVPMLVEQFRSLYGDNLEIFRLSVEVAAEAGEECYSPLYSKKSRDNVSALNMLNTAIELVPDSSELYNERGNFYRYKMNDESKAKIDFATVSQGNDEILKEALRRDLKIRNQVIAEADARKAADRKAAFNILTTQIVPTVIAAVTAPKQTQTSTASPTSTNRPAGNTTANPAGGAAGSQANGSACTPNDGTSRSAGWSACALEAGEVGALFAGTVVGISSNGPYDWNSCSQPDADNYQRCWGEWRQTGLSQVSFRLRGPFHRKNDPTRPYYWSVGFKNTSNGIVSFNPILFFGDGTSSDHGSFKMIILTPGAEYKWDDAGETESSAPTASIQITKWAFCPNAAPTTKDGQSVYQCVGR